MVPRIKTKYKDEVRSIMMKEFDYSNIMMVPKLDKIVLNTCLSVSIQNSKLLDAAQEELTLITGQKAIITKARKSVSNFRLREGMPIGAKVTLRRIKMWEFFDRFTAVSIPRIRDFRGLAISGFDGRGNFTMGITEQIIFPEIEYDKIKKINGMNITFVTNANNDEEARSLLSHLGMPFRSN